MTHLLRELGPLAIATSIAFYAGYWRGRRVEFQRWMRRVVALGKKGAANG